MRKIKKNDEVIVLSGDDKGKIGNIKQVIDNNYAIVSGINIIKRHTKPRREGDAGGIIEKESPIHISNLMLYYNGQATKVGFKKVEATDESDLKAGKKYVKYRYSKKNDEIIPNNKV